ncbi:hypothetical protein CC79DRAFT_1365805 [Sarocladium strictum]
MPDLEDVEYSHEEAVQAVRGYYTFLTNMYLDSARIAEPPTEDGWPNITSERCRTFGKTTEVIDLLKHLPYITGAPPDAWGNRPHAGPHIWFLDYARELSHHLDRPLDEKKGKSLRLITEDLPPGQVPSHVVGLIAGDAEGSFLLDTRLGVIHWTDCPREIQNQIRFSKKGIYPAQESENATRQDLHTSKNDGNTIGDTRDDMEGLDEYLEGIHLHGSQDDQHAAVGKQDDSEHETNSSGTFSGADEEDPDMIEQILNDGYDSDWFPEEEQGWRGDSGKWTIPDFFEVLKLHFLTLDWVPICDNRVLDVWSAAQHGKSRMLAEVQAIWREHGWPAAQADGSFDKVACLAHIRRFLCEKYPDVWGILALYP